MGTGAKPGAGKLSVVSAIGMGNSTPSSCEDDTNADYKLFHFEISQVREWSRHIQPDEHKHAGIALGLASKRGCQLSVPASSGATLTQLLQHHLSHYLYKEPNFQVPGNKLQMGQLWPHDLLRT